ncbi:MAG TPA: biotin/lipoyl-containing protein [Gemmatimonadaceae bacterium]|nr:biotin/lipoyl-containing protein [Gemmatimonadaceae bacterium]
MKYIVKVAGSETPHEVVVVADAVHVDGDLVVGHVSEIEGTPVRMVTIGDAVHRVVVRRGSARGDYTLWVGGHRFDVEALDERTSAIRELSKLSATAAGPAPLIAPMPGLIVRINVKAGDQVGQGQGLVVMEAMKMENELRAAAAGIVKSVNVTSGTAVEKGTVLIEME